MNVPVNTPAAGSGSARRRRWGGTPRKGPLPLGEILVARHELTRERLAEALTCQPQSERRLGDLLIARGWASPMAVASAVAEQWGLEAVDLDAEPADGGLIDASLAEVCLAHRVLPWRRLDDLGVVHVTDRPEEAVAALSVLGALGAMPGALAIVPPQQLDRALAHHLGDWLASRAATRTPPRDSVRGLGWRRFAAMAGVLGLAAGCLAGGPAALGLALGGLLAISLATTTLRVMALAAGTLPRHLMGPEVPDPGSLGAVPLAGRRPLPVVTLFVPLYREAGMVGEVAAALKAIDYPPELLDVKLLLEEDDRPTREAVAEAQASGVLPPWIGALHVPAGTPRTKPRAMNFALDFARGDVVGILDAEDRPAADQVRLVAETLRAAPPEVACVQCQLSYYNATENWVTRCFQIEYAIWFQVLLPGFRRLGLPIPLGGTSVYFRRGALERLGGWDAHNVTEDADLGMRLARRGMRCAVLDSVTGEEASSRLGPWIRQRSRWLKGYLLTWLSHMRAPRQLWRELGPAGFLSLNVLFLGAAATYLAVPLFWGAVVERLVTGTSFWSAVLPGWAMWPLAVSLAAGQAVMLGAAALGMVRRGSPGLLVWVPTLPFYWTLGAVAAWRAVIEIVLAPYYWDKTMHGISGVVRQRDASGSG